MHAWQLCHLAMVVPIADVYYEASDPENAGRDAVLMRKTAKQIRNNLSAIAARKIRLSPGKMQVFRLLPVPLVGFVLGFVFRSQFGDFSIRSARSCSGRRRGTSISQGTTTDIRPGW